MMILLQEHGRQCMPCSAKFSMALQTEFFSTETSDFLKQISFLKSYNLVFKMTKIVGLDLVGMYMYITCINCKAVPLSLSIDWQFTIW